MEAAKACMGGAEESKQLPPAREDMEITNLEARELGVSVFAWTRGQAGRACGNQFSSAPRVPSRQIVGVDFRHNQACLHRDFQAEFLGSAETVESTSRGYGSVSDLGPRRRFRPVRLLVCLVIRSDCWSSKTLLQRVLSVLDRGRPPSWTREFA